MTQKQEVGLDAGEANLLRILLHCLKFGFENTKFEYWEYITSPYFNSMFQKVDEYTMSTLTHSKNDRIELYKNAEVINHITRSVKKIVNDISEWENMSQIQQRRIVIDVFYPYSPKIEVIDSIIDEKNNK